MSLRNFIKSGSYIDLDYIYSYLTNSDGEDPLNYEAIIKNPSEYEIVATLASSGKAKYFNKSDLDKDNYDPIKASCCVPIINKAFYIGDVGYFDGGISDPIPYKRAFEAGCQKLVVVLTRPKNDFRLPEDDSKIYRLLKKSYPETAEVFKTRAERYNQCLKEILDLEKESKLLIIAPSSIGNLKTLSQDHDQLKKLYQMGREDADYLVADKSFLYNI